MFSKYYLLNITAVAWLANQKWTYFIVSSCKMYVIFLLSYNTELVCKMQHVHDRPSSVWSHTTTATALPRKKNVSDFFLALLKYLCRANMNDNTAYMHT